MNIKKRILRFVLSFLASFLIIIQSLVPAAVVLAQEASSPSPEASPTSESADPPPSIEPSADPSPTEEPSPLPSQEQASPSPTAETPSGDNGNPSQTDQATPNTSDTSSNNQLPSPPEAVSGTDKQFQAFLNPLESAASAQLAPSVWQTGSDGKATTRDNVVLDQTYTAPQNDRVKITFTKLPDSSDKITVGEVKLTSDQQAELSAVTDTAYEFTSPMADGTFEYDLILPVPANVNKDEVVVKTAESSEELGNAQTLTEPKEVASDTITVKGLTHFTVFVLVNDVDTDNPDNLGDSDDIANGVLTAIDDTWVDQTSPNTAHGNSDSLKVRSKSGSDNRRTFVKFGLSSISSGSEISKATLRLFMDDAPGASRTYELYRVTADWDEGSVTWNAQPATFGSSSVAVSTGTGSDVWREWDVTNDAQAFVSGNLTNFGWMVRDQTEDFDNNQASFYSSENDTESKRPQLVVDFAAPDNQPTAYKSPTAEEATSGGDGNGFESDPDNAFEDGGGVATNQNGESDRHIFYNYNPFDIPAGSTINGIEVRVDWYLDSTTNTNSLSVELSWDGGESWTSAKTDITETNKEHIASLGGASDTWGRDWGPDEFTNENFRVRVTSNSPDDVSNHRDFFLDWIPVRVYYTEQEEDNTPPTSEFSSPEDDSIWNSPIYVSGSSTDEPDTTVDYVTLWFSVSGDEDWFEITQINNDQLSEPFEWSYNWVPEEEGTYDIKAEATDTAGNTEESPQVNNVTYDITNPTSDIEYPEDEQTYTQDTWNEEINGTASDEPSSGVSTIYVSIQADDSSYWWEEGLDFFCDDGNEDDQCDEILNEADFDGEFWSFEFDFIPEEGIQGYTVRSHAEDNAGNLEETNTVHFYFSTDTTTPTSTIDSPSEGSFWNEPIEIFGSSTDEPATTVDYVKFYYKTSGEEENTWNEIPDSQQNNEDEVDPFDWSFNWTPDEEGTFDIKAEATDKAGNVESSPIVEYVTYDVTDPTSEISYPEEGTRYIEDVWDDEIRGTSSDSPSSGVATVLVSIQRDTDGLYWDGGGWSEGRGDGEILNEDVDFNEEDGTWDFGFAYIEPEGADEGYTARSHAVDNAGNQEDTNIVHFFFGRAPIISDETESTVSTSSVTITWTTDFLATSRVIYDTVSHPILGEAPNYGYASSTAEFDTDPKVTSHSVTVDDLTAGTTYSYRTVSHGSPEAVGDEKSFTTTNPAAAAAASTAGTDGGGGGTAPTCGDTKPGSAPTLTGASAGTNGVSLTWSQAEGPMTYYLVTYGTSPGAQQFGNPNVGGAGTTSYTVSGLSGGVTYYFKVRAGNGCAPGDFSNELSATPGGGFVAGPAAGFAPGVLDTEEEATPAAAPTAEALGEKGEEAPSAISGRVRTLIIIFLILSGLGIAYWYWQGRSHRLFKEQG